MFITYYRRPGGKIDEAMSVSNRIRNSDSQTVNVILDFKEQKVIRCTMDGTVVPKDWEKIVTFYYQYYPKTIEQLMADNGHVTADEPETNSD